MSLTLLVCEEISVEAVLVLCGWLPGQKWTNVFCFCRESEALIICDLEVW